MESVQMLKSLIHENLEVVTLAAIIMPFAILVLFVIANIKLSRAVKTYRELAMGMEDVNIEQILKEYIAALEDVRLQKEELQRRVKILESEGEKAIKKVGYKRYDAFPGSGGELSFSLALLNEENSGIILTSLYGREENRVYLKPLIKGNCRYNLSPEEGSVISDAKVGQFYRNPEGFSQNM